MTCDTCGRQMAVIKTDSGGAFACTSCCPKCGSERRAVTSRTPEGAWMCDRCEKEKESPK